MNLQEEIFFEIGFKEGVQVKERIYYYYYGPIVGID